MVNESAIYVPNEELARMLERRKRGKFNPSREYIKKATEEYIAWGGTIKKIKAADYSIEIFLTNCVKDFNTI